jgi:hypothetical protein
MGPIAEQVQLAGELVAVVEGLRARLGREPEALEVVELLFERNALVSQGTMADALTAAGWVRLDQLATRTDMLHEVYSRDDQIHACLETKTADCGHMSWGECFGAYLRRVHEHVHNGK